MKELLPAYKKIGKKRYRETQGLYYEDFEIGDIFEHRPGRTITEVDNIWQSLFCMNNHPLHIDNLYAEKTEFKKPLVSSLITFAMICGMSVSSTSAKAIANLGWDKVRLVKPVFVGDTIYAESEIISKRMSEKRRSQGIVKVITKGIKNDSVVFLTYERSFLVPTKNEHLETFVNY